MLAGFELTPTAPLNDQQKHEALAPARANGSASSPHLRGKAAPVTTQCSGMSQPKCGEWKPLSVAVRLGYDGLSTGPAKCAAIAAGSDDKRPRGADHSARTNGFRSPEAPPERCGAPAGDLLAAD